MSQTRELISLWTVGRKRKGWVLCGLIAGAFAAAAVAAQLPIVYQSSAQISVVKKRPDPITGIDTKLLAEDHASPPQDMLKSAQVIERAIQAQALTPDNFVVPADQDLAEAIRTALTVVPGKGPSGQTPVYKLHFRGRDAPQCKAILASIVDSYREFMDARHQSMSRDTLELILREKQALEVEIAKNDSAYRAFREKAPLLGKGKDGLELRQERLTTIQTRRSALLLQKVELEGQLSALEAAIKDRRSPDVIRTMLAEFVRKHETAEPGREKVVSMQDQLLPLLLEERKLLQLHGGKHPEVQDVRKRIEMVQRLMVLPPSAWRSQDEPGGAQAQQAQDVDPIKLHLQVLKQKLEQIQIAEARFATVFQAEQDEARRLAIFEIDNDSYRVRAAMNQATFESLVKRMNEVSLIRNVGGYQIELLEPPSLGKRVAPSLALALTIGAVLGMGLAFGLACWQESRHADADTPDETWAGAGKRLDSPTQKSDKQSVPEAAPELSAVS
jgi:uncharacterized protein involved in exopolysaccharide biosynthesis